MKKVYELTRVDAVDIKKGLQVGDRVTLVRKVGTHKVFGIFRLPKHLRGRGWNDIMHDRRRKRNDYCELFLDQVKEVKNGPIQLKTTQLVPGLRKDGLIITYSFTYVFSKGGVKSAKQRDKKVD